MLEQAFEALKTFDWGTDPTVLKPIDEAIIATHGDAKARKELETRLAAVLNDEVPRPAREFVCRSLTTVGTAVSVPTLAELLTDADLSHMARYALEAIPGTEATQALVDALPKAPTKIKIGITSSLGARAGREDVGIATFVSMLADKDPANATAGALALGSLGSPEAAKALSSASATDTTTKLAIADGLLACAENLLSTGNKAEAKAAYEQIVASNPSKAVKVAATLGITASS